MGRAVDSIVPVMDAESRSVERACYVRDQLPAGGLFAGATWRVAPSPFPLSAGLVGQLEKLGGQLLSFYRACNLMYRHSVAGKLPHWIADYLDVGKPQFVPLAKRAWHAGISRWRAAERCNDFSVGVELEGTGRARFSDAQYRCLGRLVRALAARLPLRACVAHSDVAPGRKRDPGTHFDWLRCLAGLARS